MCDGDEESNQNEIELKTSIDTADASENEIDDKPEFEESELPKMNANPEITTEIVDVSVDNTKEVELGIDISEEKEEEESGSGLSDEESAEMTTEINALEITEESLDEDTETTEKPMDVTDMASTTISTTENIVTEMTKTVTTDAPEAAKDITTDSALPDPSEAPKRKFDDSRIIFSDEAIDSRNKVLATRVFIDDGLLSPRTSTEKAVPSGSSDSDRIFFPDQDFKG